MGDDGGHHNDLGAWIFTSVEFSWWDFLMIYFSAAIQDKILSISDLIRTVLKPEWVGDARLRDTTLKELNVQRDYWIGMEKMEQQELKEAQKKRLKEEMEQQHEQRKRQKLTLQQNINKMELDIEEATDKAIKRRLALELKNLQAEMDLIFGGLS